MTNADWEDQAYDRDRRATRIGHAILNALRPIPEDDPTIIGRALGEILVAFAEASPAPLRVYASAEGARLIAQAESRRSALPRPVRIEEPT